MLLTQILQPVCIKAPLAGKTKEDAIEELVNLLADHGYLTDRADAFEAVMARENTRSTGIGSGIAIPHGKCSAAKELVMAVGIAAEP
ncbi:MAG TPA: PTS sugar transporter subunit IIA, partial [Anaerohalosphaeraceae bacterium]|nr:PTS sugar transporter subunit IIA [Anaerohalosphaeraceae bacterium]